MKIPVLAIPSNVTKVGDECVVLPNNITEDCLVGLANETASFILERIDGIKSIEQIADDLCEIYDVDKPTAVDVIKGFVISLIEKGVCIWKADN